jgi:hypothetical protein
MNALRAIPSLDAQPVLDLIQRSGGTCSFDEALQALFPLGFSESHARDALWQFLSDGRVEFTADRKLKVPGSDVPEQAE